MQVSVEATEGLERKMTIAVPNERIETDVDSRLREAAKTVRINGFRQGKVPFNVVKKRFGKGVRGDVIGELMSQSFYDAVTQEKLKPAGQPKIEPLDVVEGEDLKFVATFEVYPDIKLPDFKKIAIEKPIADVESKDIDQMVETLREQKKDWIEVSRKANDKDLVNIDYLGKRDGIAFEGGDAKGTNLLLGSDQMIPGFEAGIIGKKPGDSFSLDLTFPESYHNADLAGAGVEFEITLNSVKEQKLPEVDEEFFKSFGVQDGNEIAFREEISSNMERELKSATRNKMKNSVMNALVENADVLIPKALVETEIVNLKNQAIQQMGGRGSPDASLLPDDLFNKQAEKRVILGLLMGKIMEEQKIQADPAKVRESVEELASTYESPDEVINWYYGNKEQLSVIESQVVEDEIFDFILTEAKVTEKKMGYQDAIKPDDKKTERSD